MLDLAKIYLAAQMVQLSEPYDHYNLSLRLAKKTFGEYQPKPHT
jgi:hypothetical protein